MIDEESRLMIHKNGQIEFSYNAQCVVDRQDQIITGAKACNEADDRHQLCEMIEESGSNIGAISEETLADGGYFCGEELSMAADKGYEVTVNLPKSVKGEVEIEGADSKKYHKSNFVYNKEKDLYVCPEGNELLFYYEKPGSGKSYRVRIYRCMNKSCKYCNQCTKSKRGRDIERTPFDEIIHKQIRKQSDRDKPKLLCLRKEIVEPVFGWIKRNQGFQRWSFRNFDAVDTQWKMICTTINLKKMYRKWLSCKASFG